MRPVEVTNAEIILAGIHLKASGKAVNGFSLRKRIGAGNPARLMRVWDQSAGSHDQAHNVPVGDECAPEEGIATPPTSAQDSGTMQAEVTALREQVKALQDQLEASQKESVNLATQVQQASLVVDAVTDDLNRYKLRCADLEGNARQHQQRIVELHARVDEQRGELNRGSQARLALQKALDAILASSKTTEN